MGHVRRAPSGRYEARYRSVNGIEHSQRFTTKREAQRFLERIGAEQQRGDWCDPSGGRIRLGDWIEQWSATTVHLRPSSQARDESYIRNHVLPTFATIPIGRITQLDVRAWVADLSASGLAPATVQKSYQTLSKILRSAMDANLLPQTPCRNISLPRVERKEMRFLTPAEIARLASAITPRYRALILLDAYCGLRLGELAGLRRSRLDIDGRSVRVAEIAVEVRGRMTVGPPKTRAGHRTVPMPRFVAEAMNQHLAHYCVEEADPFVFGGSDGGVLRANAWRSRHWRTSVRAAGLQPLRPHDLRHTAVSLWIAVGARPNQIAAWAGHTSVSVVLDRYGHLFPGHETDVLDRLDALGSSLEP